MARLIGLTRMVLVLCAITGALSPTAAQAQSPIDGFDPGEHDQPVSFVALQPDGKIVVAGPFTKMGGVTRNHIARLDANGVNDPTFTSPFNAVGDIHALAVLPDGKILVGGNFVVGVTAEGVIRLNSDGTVDNTFTPPNATGAVWTLAVQADGKIVVGGQFTMLHGVGRMYIGRLNENGSLDTGFNPGADHEVLTLAVQPDQKILAGGFFTTLGGSPRNHIGRLEANGSIDAGFDPGASGGPNPNVSAFAVQLDGKILVSGFFTTLAGATRNSIGRLTASGVIDASFNPDAGTGAIGELAIQDDGKIVVAGQITTLGGTARERIGRLNVDGSLDQDFNPGANSGIATLAVQPDGRIVAGGVFTIIGGATRFGIARLNANGSAEITFNPGTDTNGTVYALAHQPDRKTLVGGVFTTLGGATRERIGRLNADGTLDTTFANQGTLSDLVFAIAVQPDGKIVTLGGASPSTISRLNSDGTPDAGFVQSGANVGTVAALALQVDGKIIVGGGFGTLGGQPRARIGRLNSDGSLDMSFNPGAADSVYTVAVQPDGMILVGGNFLNLGGQPRSFLGRLDANGVIDSTFNPGADGIVRTMVVQADGKILVGGSFSTLGGALRKSIGRLNADGSIDTSFNPGAVLDPNLATFVEGLAVQTDGSILVGGNFSTLGGALRSRLGRLTAAGAIDNTFNPGASGTVFGFVIQPDGKIAVGGPFVGLGGVSGTTPRSNIGRLTNNTFAVQSLTVSTGGGVVSWLRSGSQPEVSRVTFEMSTDGVTYTPLGNGTRVAGGWRLAGQSLPIRQNLLIRARGYYTTGIRNQSASIVESIAHVYAPHQIFTDDLLVAGESVIKAVHITELRTRIDLLRARYALGAFAYSNATLVAGSSVVQAVDVSELRVALAAAYAAAGLPAPTYATSPAAGVLVFAADIATLRNAVGAIE